MLAGCGGAESGSIRGSETVTVTETVVETRKTVETETAEAEGAPPFVIPPPPEERPPVYVLNFQDVVYQPRTIAIGASNGILRIKWKSYGGPQARGEGVMARCSSSGPGVCPKEDALWERVRFTLSAPRACNGVVAYTILLWEDHAEPAYELGECS
jgi:hypothetical protein